MEKIPGIIKKMNAPIFVVGPPRSGTTLTAKILGRHSRIFMPGETHFFDDIYVRRRELGDPQNPQAMERIIERLSTLYRRYDEPSDQARIERLMANPTIVADLKHSCMSYRDILSFFMTLQMQQAGKTRWGNNVPKDIFHLKEVISFYPDAKILICIRDVRDFLLSYRNQWRTTSWENTQRLLRLYHPIITSLLWKASVKHIAIANSLIPSDNLMVIQYESLVQRPEEIIRNICTFLGEEFEEDMLAVSTHNSSFQIQSQGIFSSSVGRWRENLSKEEVYIAQKITYIELERLGYSVERIVVDPLKLTRIVIRLPDALWNTFNANRVIRGPLLPYLLRRVTSLLP